VAKSVRGPRSGARCRCSTTDHAIASPSWVEVPRPISSRMISERSVYRERIQAVSLMRILNVVRPSYVGPSLVTCLKAPKNVTLDALAWKEHMVFSVMVSKRPTVGRAGAYDQTPLDEILDTPGCGRT
jgi:hypothetical protein